MFSTSDQFLLQLSFNTSYKQQLQQKEKNLISGDKPHVVIHTDGSHKSTTGGWAALMQHQNQFNMLYGNDLETTNNRMELMAVVAGLERLAVPCRVTIYSDSIYFVRNLTDSLHYWVHNGWRTKQRHQVANQDLWSRIFAQTRIHEITPIWVKGHNNCAENVLVDWFAGKARLEPVGMVG